MRRAFATLKQQAGQPDVLCHMDFPAQHRTKPPPAPDAFFMHAALDRRPALAKNHGVIVFNEGGIAWLLIS